VSVVIPTVGRATLERAVNSVRQQTYPRVEVIVVVDGPQTVEVAADRVAVTGGGTGGGFARQLGTSLASGDYVAYLDDDDEWMPSKLAAQVRAAREHPSSVIAARHVQVDPAGRLSRPIPERVVKPEDDVAAYLFRRRRPGAGRPSIYTSTILCSREVALANPWRPISRHQDWDWIVRAARSGGVMQLPEPLVRIHIGSSGSISASMDWESSLAWADEVLAARDPRTYTDFLAAQTLRYAFGARSAAGVSAVLTSIRRSGHLPSIGPILIGLAGLLPRRTIERLMAIVH
jgi:glycosyltransferase involved in cell wall biosynthesis